MKKMRTSCISGVEMQLVSLTGFLSLSGSQRFGFHQWNRVFHIGGRSQWTGIQPEMVDGITDDLRMPVQLQVIEREILDRQQGFGNINQLLSTMDNANHRLPQFSSALLTPFKRFYNQYLKRMLSCF